MGVPMGGTADSLNDRIYDIPILQQQAGTFYNFGELEPASLDGRVFRDYENTGQYNPAAGDYGISGVLITLRGIDDPRRLRSRNHANDRRRNLFVRHPSARYL